MTNVRIERVSGTLTDHYDPRANVIRLSDGVFDSTSVAAVGIACHEAGHAVQYAKNYAPIRMRNAILPVCNVGSKIGIPLAIIGLVIGSEGNGLGKLVKEQCDFLVSIPMRGHIDSLNAGVAAGILMFEKRRQDEM